MEIKIDYYIKQDKQTRLMHTTISENDIMELLESKFRSGDLSCPIQFDRDKANVRFEIDKVII